MGIFKTQDNILSAEKWPWGFLVPSLLPEGPQGWSGKFITVGLGKKYTDINNAVAAAENGDMLLVYPGTYTPTSQWTKKMFIRGMGVEMGDVRIEDAGSITGVDAGADIFMEWVQIRATVSWQRGFIVVSPDVICRFNKCYFSCATSTYALGANNHLADLTFINCRIDRGYGTFVNLNQNLTSLIKCYAPRFYSYQSSGTLLQDDYISDSALPLWGYSYTDGDFVITNEFLAYYGY